MLHVLSNGGFRNALIAILFCVEVIVHANIAKADEFSTVLATRLKSTSAAGLTFDKSFGGYHLHLTPTDASKDKIKKYSSELVDWTNRLEKAEERFRQHYAGKIKLTKEQADKLLRDLEIAAEKHLKLTRKGPPTPEYPVPYRAARIVRVGKGFFEVEFYKQPGDIYIIPFRKLGHIIFRKPDRPAKKRK